MKSRLAFIYFYLSHALARFGYATRRNIRLVRYGVACFALLRLMVKLTLGR